MLYLRVIKDKNHQSLCACHAAGTGSRSHYNRFHYRGRALDEGIAQMISQIKLCLLDGSARVALHGSSKERIKTI